MVDTSESIFVKCIVFAVEEHVLTFGENISVKTYIRMKIYNSMESQYSFHRGNYFPTFGEMMNLILIRSFRTIVVHEIMTYSSTQSNKMKILVQGLFLEVRV